ncbi:MAG: CDP-alcohol phosphatidyltransferase family protein [Bifidobacteriaceae bacterium]|nr:CDP-alcohol phosphatidyltransferase family protein [Bifidobacteriaceae bacterium]
MKDIEKKEVVYSPEPRDTIFTVPNLISLLRILFIPIVAYYITQKDMVSALVLLGISAISDGLDGLIARSFNQVSKLGQILDPIADRVLIFFSILALGIAGIVPWWMLIIVGLRDALMTVLVFMLAQKDYGPLPVHFVGKSGTALLMMSIVALIVAELWHNFATYLLHMCALSVGIWGIGLYWFAGYLYIKQAVGLLQETK